MAGFIRDGLQTPQGKWMEGWMELFIEDMMLIEAEVFD